jgi:hypothetical protein
LKRLRPRLTYANVMVTILAFVVLGGATAFAAGQIGKNSVGSKQLRKNAVTGAKVKDQSLTGKDIKLSKLGTVPSATNAAHATSADTASALTPPEAIHEIGAPGQPPFLPGASNVPSTGLGGVPLTPAGFYKDHDGVVHLEGTVQVSKTGTPPGQAFILPVGFRPASGTIQLFDGVEDAAVIIGGTGVIIEGLNLEGMVLEPGQELIVLSGITFKAAS